MSRGRAQMDPKTALLEKISAPENRGIYTEIARLESEETGKRISRQSIRSSILLDQNEGRIARAAKIIAGWERKRAKEAKQMAKLAGRAS